MAESRSVVAHRWRPWGRTGGRGYKGHNTTCASGGYICYLDYYGGFMSVYICPSYQVIFFKYVQLYVNYSSVQLWKQKRIMPVNEVSLLF